MSSREEDTSILEIFQDPLLTIVALILLGTVWIVIPSEGPQPERVPETPRIQEQVDDLRIVLKNLDGAIADLLEKMRQLAARLQSLEAARKERLEETEKDKRRIDELLKEIAKLAAMIQEKKKELAWMQERLQAESRKGEQEKEEIGDLERKVSALRQEIEAKESLLRELEKRLQGLQKDAREVQSSEAEQEKVLQSIEEEVKREEKGLANLVSEKSKLQEMLAKMPGFGEYADVKNKRPLGFDTIDNRILAIDDNNYDVKIFQAMVGGQVTKIVEISKKKAGSGEGIDRIPDPTSQFQRELKKHSNKEYYLVFKVHKDSFALFHRAREIAWKEGFQVDWDPRGDGPITVPLGGEGASHPTGRGPKAR